MSKLRLGNIESDKVTRISIKLSATVHHDLLAYAQALATATHEKPLEPAKLIPAMVERFMATDRGFAKFRREHTAEKSQQVP